MTEILEPLPTTFRRFLPRTRDRLALAAVTLLMCSVLGGWHYWTLVSSLRDGKAELLAARAGLTSLDLEVTSAELAVASDHAVRADAALARADAHFSRDPLLRLAGILPGIGPQVDATEELIEAGRVAAAIAREASAAGEAFVAVREARRDGDRLANTLVHAIETTRPRVERIERLTGDLMAHRRALGDNALLPPLASARETLDADLNDLAARAAEAARGFEVLPGILGFEGDRRYPVLALNNGELLPGGGLVSAAGVVTVRQGDPGEVDFADSTRWKDEWEAKGGEYISPPGPLQRYLLRDYTWNLLVSNWDPDFPTWSRQALELYELIHGVQDVDGVLALDLEVLRRLLAVTGPRTLEVEGYGKVTFTSEDAILELERLTRQSFEQSENRKSVIGDLARLLLDEMSDLSPERWGTLVDTVAKLAAGRHIQLFSFDGKEQAFLRDAGWDGALQPVDGDYLHFNEASVNSTKLNLIIQPEASYRIDISAAGDARHHLALAYHNPLPEWRQDKDAKLVKQLMLGGLYGGYLRVFSPGSVRDWSVEIGGATLGIEDTAEEQGLRWFGIFMPLPEGTSATPTFRWTVPLATSASRADSYELLIQKQPGTAGMCIDLLITREGQSPAQFRTHGGRWDDKGRICLTTDVHVRAEWR